MWQVGKTERMNVLRKAYEWQEQYPAFLRASARFHFDNAEDLASDLIKGHNFYAMNGQLCAIINAEDVGCKTYEGHLFCSRKTNPALVTSAIAYAKDWVFNNTDARQIVSMVRKKHRGLKTIVENAGFKPLGIEMWKGSTAHNKVFATEMYAVFRG